MIVLFHCLSIIIFQLLRNRKRIKHFESNRSVLETNSCVNVNTGFNLKFDPPVYRQRYGKVYEILLDERWRTNISNLVDFGCAEFGLFVYIKRLNNLKNIFFVDIDENTLKQFSSKVYPLVIDHIKTREIPLQICIFAGSVSDPDCRLHDIDVVTAIELIEHLYPDDLDAFPYNVFNYIKPKLVIITTPNSDFNVLFPGNLTTFRHSDHKFEWSRQQFEEWANNLTIRFPNYMVSFYGIGEGPEGTENLGQCSQMAVFIRKDLLEDTYISESNDSHCLCGSLCKRLTARSQLLCSCVCVKCEPSASYGICTYYTYSKQIIPSETDQEQNGDVYYKFIENIQYPVSDDCRTEEQKMKDELAYRINYLGRAQGRFFVEERNRSEIPVQDLIYGTTEFSATQFEIEKLLPRLGYEVEECRIQETGLLQTCVIYEPVMEEVSSTSEASGYDSDFAKCPLNEESLSDWDDPSVKKDSEKPSSSCREIACLGMTSHEVPLPTTGDTEEEKKQDSLFDSGYQKSLSLLDDSPQTPLEELEETDVFEDTTSTPSLTSEDNKVHLKKASILEKHNHVSPPPLPPTDINKLKFDVNRINEMDKFHNIPSGRTFFNHFVPPPEVLKKSFFKDRDAIPGPSSGPSKKRKKFKKNLASDTDDESPFEDVKSITNCLIENTLNKLDVKEDKKNLIEYVEPEPGPEIQQEVQPLPAAQVQLNDVPPIVEDIPVVENGDLANNNRDIEGNNYVAQEEAVENIGNDIVNDNLEAVEELPHIQEENANFDNNNRQVALLQVVEDPFVMIEEEGHVENAENGLVVENVLGAASREALFDPNSEQDSLEDFEVPPALHEMDNLDPMNPINTIIFIGVHPTPEENEEENLNGFPHWLLQILGTQVVIEGEAPAGSQDEPHFYCQGDGLGVHPSVIAVEIDEEEDDEDSTDSTNNTVDFAQLDQAPSSSHDMTSLPEDQLHASDVHADEEPAAPPTMEQQEFLETSSTVDMGGSGSS